MQRSAESSRVGHEGIVRAPRRIRSLAGSTVLLGLLGLLGLSGGCAHLDEQRERDRGDLDGLIETRVGVDWDSPEGDGGVLPPRARQLLEVPLTEDSAVKIALLGNRSVRVQLAQLGVASAELVQAGLLSNPVLTATAKFFGGGTEIEIGLVESFFDVFFVSARKRIQESDLEATKARIARAVVGIVHDVRRAFVRVRATERLVEMERQILRGAQASADLMKELHRAGNVTDPVMTADEVTLVRAKLALARAEAARVEERESLSVLLGLGDEDLAWTIEGTLPDEVLGGLDLDRLENRVIEKNLELAELRAEATAEARRAGLAAWEATLDPGEVGLVAQRDVGSSEWGLGPTLGFSLPVFDTGSTRRAIAAGKIELARERHVAKALQVRSEARRIHKRLLALVEQVSLLQGEQLPMSSRLVRETLRNYNAMQIGVFEVFVAKQQEIDARRTHVETLRDAWLARLDLEELLAGSQNEASARAETSASGHDAGPSRPGAH